jgi:hypothetical protein
VSLNHLTGVKVTMLTLSGVYDGFDPHPFKPDYIIGIELPLRTACSIKELEQRQVGSRI